jgi:predicted small integral membrane protein
MMDSTFPNNRGIWRALNAPAWHTAFYLAIIVWEAVTTFLCWRGGVRLTRALRAPSANFHRAKNVSIAALTLSLLMWLAAFLSVGAEWFLMWQSKMWNGQEAAFRMFTVVALVLLLLAQPDTELHS